MGLKLFVSIEKLKNLSLNDLESNISDTTKIFQTLLLYF